MKARLVVVVTAIIAAGACASSVEQNAAPQISAQDTSESYAALHAAIPASADRGNVFEYSTVVPVPAEKTAVVDLNDKYFDYN